MGGFMKTVMLTCTLLLALSCFALATPIPDTGQTACYDNLQEIPCPAPGEPFYGQDAQYPCNPQSYTKLDKHGNDLPALAPWPWAMVRDNVTGLIWEMKTENGSIHHWEYWYKWYAAKHFFIPLLNLMRFGGFSDWRLPTVMELAGIVSHHPQDYPPINTFYFKNTKDGAYWSSQSLTGSPRFAWYVDYSSGFPEIYDKRMTYIYIRAVRGTRSFNDFKDNGDGTVTDEATGLMWQQGTAPGLYNWEEALAYCENLTFAGYDDWRLPKLKELQSIVDYTRYHPSIDPIFADTVSYAYWSSTTIPYPESASNVSFYYGSGTWYEKTARAYVRAVRGGQCEGN
jgi:hypothetical protein